MFTNLEKNQSDVVKLLRNSFKKQRVVHTYLFHGQKGTMKMEAARYFASLLLCENDGACGKCLQCESIAKNKNANVFIITPEGRSIKKEQILDLAHEFSLYSDQKRVYIIEHIDLATPASANSLLKFLEEGNENNYGILITENINMVLPTIRSRSLNIAFMPINRNLIYDRLTELKVKPELASIISTITNDPEEAISLAKDKDFIEMVDLVKKIGFSFESDVINPCVLFKSEGKKLLQAERLIQEQFLGLLITLQNDKIKYMINPEADIVFRDLLENNQITLSQEQELKILEIMIDLQTKIRYNLSVELALVNMLIEIAGCIND